MERKLYKIEDVKSMISQGKKLVLTGDETALSQLPDGDWIGGTIPYFMNEDKGKFTKDEIFVDDFTELGIDFKLTSYDVNSIQNIAKDSFENGIVMTIIPAGSACHTSFSLNSLEYEDIFNNPVVGYIAGLDLNLMDTAKAGVYLGSSQKIEDGAVAMHIALPENKVARVEIVNIFDQNTAADTITFLENNFTQKDCLVNGEKRNLSEYLKEIDYNVKLPFTNDKGGAVINSSIQSIDEDAKVVNFYAPMFTDIDYKAPLPVEDYAKEFEQNQPKGAENIQYACNCILNYLYGELEGKTTTVTATATFGEIAYQLLNQTMVYVVIDEM